MCGEDNYQLVKLLEDHAKGNVFLAQMGRIYGLDQWAQNCPRSKEPKDWADLFEAWFGAVIRELRLFDANDSLEELTLFIVDIWKLRYRHLKDYFIENRQECYGENENDFEEINSSKIILSRDRLSPCSVDEAKDEHICLIGYEVSVRRKMSSTSTIVDAQPVTAFDTTQELAEARAKRLASITTESSNSFPLAISESPQAQIQDRSSSVSKTTMTLFQKYRYQCFDEIIKIRLDGEPPGDTIIREMGIKYYSWTKELQLEPDNDDRRKTLVMLKWYQVFDSNEKF